jgi:hypothetical protein
LLDELGNPVVVFDGGNEGAEVGREPGTEMDSFGAEE